MREVDIEKMLVREVEKSGAKAIKFEVPGKRGMPDRIILIPSGKVIFVEVKAPGEKPRPLQQKRINDLKELGFKVEVVDSVEAITRIAEVVKWLTSNRTPIKNIQSKK